MGYYTQFRLTIRDSKGVEVDSDTVKAVASWMAENLRDFDNDECFELTSGNWTDVWKWYHWEYDVCKMAKAFPNLWFTLKGEGADRDDVWIFDVKNGGESRCKRRAELIHPENKPIVWY